MVKEKLIHLLRQSGYWLGVPLLVTATGLLTDGFISQSSLLMLFLIAVLVCSIKTDHIAVILCSLLSFALFNYFFTTPRYSLLMTDLNEFVSALIFVIFSILAGSIAYSLKTQFVNLEKQRDFLKLQVRLARNLQDIQEEQDVLPTLEALAMDFFGGKIKFILQLNPDREPSQSTMLVNWVNSGDNYPDPGTETMLASLREQVNSAFDKHAIDKALKHAERKSDEDHLRSALLSSVSHDLKTPLVTMIGAASSLQHLNASLNEADKKSLLDSIISESRRLESYIQNLLDMTRLGHGELPLSREWTSVEEIYHVVMKRIRINFPDAIVTLNMAGNVPSIHVHAALIEQALFNGIENAIKAGGETGEVSLDVVSRDHTLEIRISDHGPGLPDSQWEKVFDQFYTFSQGDHYKKGTGLGLGICRSIFRVHQGDAQIVTPPEGYGHCLQLTLPVAPANQE
jgi:two-component system sensor histidine kinase KdpD